VITVVLTQLVLGAFYMHQQFVVVLANLDVAGRQEQLTGEQLMKKLEQYNQQNKILLFVGDIMLSRDVGKRIAEQGNPRTQRAEQSSYDGDPSYPFMQIADVTRAADLAFANVENPISSRGKNQGSQYSFRADPETVKGLEFAGFDVVSVANNHIWDWGADALADTLSILRTNNIVPIGAGLNYAEANDPKIIAVGKSRIAFLAYTTLYPRSLEATKKSIGISHFEIQSASDAVRKAKQQADVVVVSLHWGEEYKTEANEEQKTIAHALVDAGADLIIGHHPHVAQEYEQYSPKGEAGKTGWIYYSLGNFVFDQPFSKETMEGLMARAVMKNGRIVKVEPVQIKISPAYQPYIE